MGREKLILKWEELEFEHNGEELTNINFDDYSIAELKEEIEVLKEAMNEAFDELELENL